MLSVWSNLHTHLQRLRIQLRGGRCEEVRLEAPRPEACDDLQPAADTVMQGLACGARRPMVAVTEVFIMLPMRDIALRKRKTMAMHFIGTPSADVGPFRLLWLLQVTRISSRASVL
jgi:hypothetical protein